MNFEFPLPFLAPSFYQLDFSEIPVLVGAFAMGPIAGILIEVVKVLVHLVTMGTMTAGVGDFANFLFGCTFVVPAGIIYRLHPVSYTHLDVYKRQILTGAKASPTALTRSHLSMRKL